MKKELKQVSESAQKQYDDFAAAVSSATAKSMGGTRLFDTPSSRGNNSSPLASPLITSPLLTVPDKGDLGSWFEALPFKINPLKANLVNEVKEWAAKLFGDGGEREAKQQKGD